MFPGPALRKSAWRGGSIDLLLVMASRGPLGEVVMDGSHIGGEKTELMYCFVRPSLLTGALPACKQQQPKNTFQIPA
jgi:hypothetical protein